MKQKFIFIITTIFSLCLIGCSAVPKARITNVDSLSVVRTLYQNGSTRTEVNDPLGAAFAQHFEGNSDRYKTYRTTWPDPDVIHNNKKMTIEYNMSGGLWARQRCKDTIVIDVQQSKETILSVKCEVKKTNHGTPHVLALIFEPIENAFTFYKRDSEREKSLMINTIESLQTEHQAQIEWLGKWRPDTNSP